MHKSLLRVIAFLLLSAAPVWAADKQANNAVKSQVDDEQVIAVLELLELMDLVQDMDLLKEMHYLIEGDPNETQETASSIKNSPSASFWYLVEVPASITLLTFRLIATKVNPPNFVFSTQVRD